MPHVAALIGGDAARALPDRHQRARGDPLPARAAPARSRSPAWSPARSPRAAASARPCRAGSSTASASAACCRRSALVHAAALGLLVLTTELGAPTAVLVLCGLLAGFAIPPTSSVLRSMWPTLLRGPAAPAPARLRAGLRADRADLHPRPAADRPADRARRAAGRADRLRGERDRRHAAVHRAAAVARLAARARGAERRPAGARSARPACAAWC